ncbi:hypothetical protein JTE90_007008 [Oedothorax gibbosus]|uniref:NYN domain-containing protein n=1 Tax=Oedothorax gibbosus TaxID=931172 RepID=A0AAV6TXE1_9ARAC|nr:hypothetical protein JTE90_007008 [Oedothorax gibbosus]
MSQIRQLKTKEMQTFKNLFDQLWNNASNYKRIKRIDFVFDSYVEHSLKEGERERRRNVDPIELIKIEQDTPIPIQMDRFWSSCKNKEMLQSAAATSFIEKAKMANFTTVLSAKYTDNTGDNDSRDAKIVMNKEVQICSDVRTSVEEGRIVMHLFHAVQSSITCLIVLSNDTDVVVLLRYIFQLFSNELQELWIKNYVKKKTENMSPGGG